MVNHWWIEDEKRTACGETDEVYEYCSSHDRVSCNECYDSLPAEVQAEQYWWLKT
jgi:hypothetical protein